MTIDQLTDFFEENGFNVYQFEQVFQPLRPIILSAGEEFTRFPIAKSNEATVTAIFYGNIPNAFSSSTHGVKSGW